jgi:Tfp pilus assembly protein PilF
MPEMRLAEVKTFAHKPVVVLISLLVLAVAGFVLVGRLVNAFHQREQTLANRIFLHAQQQRQMGSLESAITGFRAALDYSPGNFDYELNLAETLAQAKHYDQARVYLMNLAERVPQSAEVNLALARIAQQAGQVQDAIRYYHRAIYGIWKGDADRQRRLARVELVRLLLDNHEETQARSELIASVASPPSDPELRTTMGDLFLKTGDPQDALLQFQGVLKTDPNHVQALLGAAYSYFQLKDFRSSQRYLEQAVKLKPLDADGAELLALAKLVQDHDPYLRNLSEAARRERVSGAYQQAGDRLKSCAASQDIDLNASDQTSALPQLYAEWSSLSAAKGRRTSLRASQNDTMELVFRIESETERLCGKPQGLDMALLLIGGPSQGAAR